MVGDATIYTRAPSLEVTCCPNSPLAHAYLHVENNHLIRYPESRSNLKTFCPLIACNKAKDGDKLNNRKFQSNLCSSCWLDARVRFPKNIAGNEATRSLTK